MNLAIIEPLEVVRRGLKAILAEVSSLRLIAESGDLDNGLHRVQELQPDIVVMEAIGSPSEFFESIRQVRQRSPQTHVVVFSASADEGYVVSAVAAGARAYILKQSESRVLICAIMAAAHGEMVLDTSVTSIIASRVVSNPTPEKPEPLCDLSLQEARILGLIAQGQSNREIASRLNLSTKTVRNYVSQVLGKLGVRSRTQAAIYAVRLGVEDRIAGGR